MNHFCKVLMRNIPPRCYSLENPTKTEFYKQLLILIEVPLINSSYYFTAYNTAGYHILCLEFKCLKIRFSSKC